MFSEHVAFPIINILSPLIQNSPLVPLQCVVNGVEGFQVRMSWNIEGRKEKGQQIRSHRHDGTIQLTRNQILITAAEWKKKVQCVCMVDFVGQHYNKTFQQHGKILQYL